MKPFWVFSILALLLFTLPHWGAIVEGDIKNIDKIVFYAVPHSHTDAGWYWTYDYYSQLASGILDSVTSYLETHPDKRFTWSDISFFQKWYFSSVKNNTKKLSVVRTLVNNGQLDLINGGLVQNDEACPLAKEIYTNYEEGMRFLTEEFGIRPTILWQLDPFGHSSATPEILKSIGINQIVLNRMSDAYKNNLIKNQDLSFIWTGDGDEEIKATVLHSHYGPDINLYFDRRWYANNPCPNPLNERWVNLLISESISKGLKVHGKTGYVLQLLGNDFFYSNAQYSFEYLDGMKSSLESMGPRILNVTNVEWKYSTLSEYFNDMAKVNYTIGKYHGDFFVYTQYKPSTSYDHYWGGYFTSRPMFKWMVRNIMTRERNLNSFMGMLNFIQKVEPSAINNHSFSSAFQDLLSVREYNPVFLHHDAITGTHGVSVNIDYNRSIQENNSKLDKFIGQIKSVVNSTQALADNTTQFLFYNPSFYTRNEIYNVTVSTPNIGFVSYPKEKGEVHDSYRLNQLSFNKDDTYTLYIEVSVPPLSHLSIEIVEYSSAASWRDSGKWVKHIIPEISSSSNSKVSLKNSEISVELNENALEIEKIELIKDSTAIFINEALYKYNAMRTMSWIYTFKPTDNASPITLGSKAFYKYSGDLVTAIQITGQDSDVNYERMVILKKNDPAVHIISQNFIKLQHDIELAFRYSSTDIDSMYTGDSLSFINRKYIDFQTAKVRNLTRDETSSDSQILGLNSYPMVDGFIASYKTGLNIGFVNSQTWNANLVSPTSFEFIVSRSVMNVNQDKGLPERLYEKSQTHFNFIIFAKKNQEEFYHMKNKYVDQMNDSLLLIKNAGTKIILPKVKLNAEETSDIDIMSLKVNQDDKEGGKIYYISSEFVF